MRRVRLKTVGPLVKFAVFQIFIIAPFAGGYFLRSRFHDLGSVTKKLIRLNLIFVEPLIVLWSVWGLELSGDLVWLPVAGLVLVLCGAGLGLVAARWLRLSGIWRATYLISAGLANHGFTLGGFICYLFLGEKGLGLSFIFISYFMPFIFLVVFPYARASSRGAAAGSGGMGGYIFNLQNMPLAAIVAAIALHAAGIHRPDIFFPVDCFLMISVTVYYLSLGINFSPGGIGGIKAENISLAAIKFLALPAIAFLLVHGAAIDPAIKTVIVVESCMPAAIYSVVAAVLFDLDVKMASGIFVVNTVVFLCVVFPVLVLALKWRYGVVTRIFVEL